MHRNIQQDTRYIRGTLHACGVRFFSWSMIPTIIHGPPSASHNNYMYRCVGHVFSAIENSIFDQILSRRSRSTWGPPLSALIARRTSPCSPLPTLQVPAETVLASSPRGGCFFCFLFLSFLPKRPFVRIKTNPSGQLSCTNLSGWTDSLLSPWSIRLRFASSTWLLWLFLFVPI